jgi:RNA polymerase sigma-70 factor (ECF subfamily)
LESIELRAALANLSRREQQLLWLVYAEGFSHREVASIMKLSQASVRVLTFRARKKLQRILVPGEDTSS